MSTIEEVYEAFSSIRLRENLPRLIKNTEYPMVLKIIEQHKRGELSTNEKITPSYGSAIYTKFKNSLNPAPGYGTPDGTLTGAYNADLHVIVTADEYDIKSSVPYAMSPSLLQYGTNFNKLSEQSKIEYCNEALFPEIEKYIAEVTGYYI